MLGKGVLEIFPMGIMSVPSDRSFPAGPIGVMQMFPGARKKALNKDKSQDEVVGSKMHIHHNSLP